MKIRVNPNFGRRKVVLSPRVNPTARANNRKTVQFRGSRSTNKAKVQNPRITSAFNGGRPFPKAKNGRGGAAMGAISRRSYLSQTASRYPRAAEFAG
jgi:hypothetical protein